MILRKTIISNSIDWLLEQSYYDHDGLCYIFIMVLNRELRKEGYYIHSSIPTKKLLEYIIPYHKRWRAVLFYKASKSRFFIDFLTQRRRHWWPINEKGYHRRLKYLLELYYKYYNDETDIISLLLKENDIIKNKKLEIFIKNKESVTSKSKN